jgi:hypothetical protein
MSARSRSLLFALGLWFASFPCGLARAQINAESLAEGVKGPGWGGAAKGSLALFRGNAELLEVSGEAALRFATAHPGAEDREKFLFRDRVLIYGSAGMRDVSGETVVNNGYAHLRYTRMQWPRFGGELYAQAQYDEVRLLRRRMVGGGGVRAVFADWERFGGWLGTGYMYERERRDIPQEDRPPGGPDPISMVNHRLSNYVTLVLEAVEDTLNFVNILYVQPRLDAFSDVQILEQLTMVIRITDRFSFNSDLQVRHDSRAPRSLKKTDLRLSQGVTISF